MEYGDRNSLYDLSIYNLDTLPYHGRRLYTLNSDVELIVFAHVDSEFGRFELGVLLHELWPELFDLSLQFGGVDVLLDLESEEVIRRRQSQEEVETSANEDESV